MRIYIYMYTCVYMYIDTCVCIYIYIYIRTYVCVCVCVCVCVFNLTSVRVFAAARQGGARAREENGYSSKGGAVDWGSIM